MDWLIPAVTSNITSTLILVLVYFFLYRQFREKFLWVWMVGWILYGVRFAAELAQSGLGPDPLLAETTLYINLASALFQLWGTYLFINRKLSRWWILLAVACAVSGQVLVWLTADTFWLSILAFVVQGMVDIWTGLVLLRANELERTSRLITGWSFILWGLHKLDYPFLRPLEWFAPWGYLLGALLGLIVALGFILVYFQRLLQEHRQMVSTVRQGNENLNRLFQKLPVMLAGFDENNQVVAWNEECTRVTGYSSVDVIGRPNIFQLFYPNEQTREAVFNFAERSGFSYRNQEWTLTAKDGSQRTILWTDLSRESPVPGWKFWTVGMDVTDQKHMEARYATIVHTMMDAFWTVNLQGQFLEVNDAACQLTGYSREEFKQLRVADIEAIEQPEEIERRLTMIRERGGDRFETRFRCKGGRIIDVEISITYYPFEGGIYIVFTRDISARKQIETSLHERVAELETVSRISEALRPASSLDELLPLLAEKVLTTIQAEVGGILVYDAARDCIDRSYGLGWADDVPKELITAQIGPLATVLRTGQPYTTFDASQDPNVPANLRAYIPSGWGGIALPLRAMAEPVGIFLAFAPVVNIADPWKMRMTLMLTEIVGAAIYQVRLRDRTQRHLNRLAALHEIDATIASSLDLRMTMEILLSQTTNQLGVDATEVLLMNPQMQRLEGLAGRGFRIYRPEHRQIRPGEGPAGRALLERRQVEFHLNTGSLGRSLADPFYQTEGICEGYALPLVSKGQIIGVMTALQRKRIQVDSDWIDFFKSLANQAALAIDDIGMVEKLRQSNTELVQSHSRIIESLSRLVEARKREREGQTHQLADLTIRLAEACGVPSADWLAIRQGAMLHDIGLISVPDAILFKPAPLTEDEWKTIRQHPQLAYELLNGSSQLRAIQDIPYCHHEHWDGSGYPRGIKGESIPLAARLFAVVEYWQKQQSNGALKRPAWYESSVQNLAELAGTWFDPQVVKTFLEMNKR